MAPMKTPMPAPSTPPITKPIAVLSVQLSSASHLGLTGTGVPSGGLGSSQ